MMRSPVSPRPPQLAAWLAAARLRGDEREFQLGDLEEEFADRAARDGVTAARRWYWRHACRNLLTGAGRKYVSRATPVPHPSPGDLMRSLRQDISFAFRLMRRAPVATLAAIVTFALGLGANIAIFSVAWPVLFAPLPFADEARLTVVQLIFTRGGRSFPNNVSPGDYFDMRKATSFESMASYNQFVSQVNLTGHGDAMQVRLNSVNDDFFTVLGVRPIVGRPLQSGDAEAPAPVAVLKEATWRRVFGADPAIIGRTIALDGDGYQIVGVLPDSAGLGTRDADVWIPRTQPPGNIRRAYFLGVVGRLKPGVTLDAANQELAAIMRGAAREFPDSNRDVSAAAFSFREQLTGPVRQTFLLLVGAAACVLLIAALNLAGLQVARSLQRGREMQIRLSLGASRSRLVRLLVVESVVLALVGGFAGLWAATAMIASLRSLAPALVWSTSSVLSSTTVLTYTALLSVVSGVIVGALPAWRAARQRGSLAVQTRDVTLGRAGTRARVSVVSLQVGVTVVLLIVASLVSISLLRVLRVNPGFDLSHSLVANVSLPGGKYSSAADRTRFFDAYVERLAAIPGVEAACATNDIPLDNPGANMTFVADGSTALVGSNPKTVTPGCFATMQIPILQGRGFSARELEPVAIVSARMAAALWPPAGEQTPVAHAASVIGRKIHLGLPTGDVLTVVGVVPDILNVSLESRAERQVWLPHSVGYFPPERVIVRTSVPAEAVAPAMRSALRELDPSLALARVRTMDEVVATATASRRFVLVLFMAFAMVALVLSAVGIYGVLAHVVGQRSREIGIRLALGARRGAVTRMIVGHMAIAIAAGAAAGVLVARLLSTWFASLLFRMSATDATVYAGVVGFVGLTAVVAAWAPTRRAARVNPVSALRAD